MAHAHEFVGEWLSLVEHLVRDQGVGGSNPLSPTNLFNNFQTTSCTKNRAGLHLGLHLTRRRPWGTASCAHLPHLWPPFLRSPCHFPSADPPLPTPHRPARPTSF